MGGGNDYMGLGWVWNYLLHMEQRRYSLGRESNRLQGKIQRLRQMGVVIPKEGDEAEKKRLGNYFRVVEESMKADSLAQHRGSSWKPAPKVPRKIYAHQKVETSTFDTIEQLIVKNRTNLEYLKSYSRNIKESIKADTIHTDTAKANTIKKSVFIEEPQQNLIQGFVDAEMEQFVTQKFSTSQHKQPHSTTLNNFGRLTNSASMHQMRSSTSQVSVRKAGPLSLKMTKIKLAAKQINENQSRIYEQIKSSLRKSNSAISIRSNYDRANILFGSRWNKVYNRVVQKYGLEKEDRLLAEQLELCPAKNVPTEGVAKVKAGVFNIEECKEYLKRTPILRFSRV